MVKVLANGDVVPDDDPRAGGRSNVSRAAERNQPTQVHTKCWAIPRYYRSIAILISDDTSTVSYTHLTLPTNREV